MSLKGLWVAASLSAAHTLLLSSARAQSPNPLPLASLAFMEKQAQLEHLSELARSLNISLAKAIVLGRNDAKNTSDLAILLGAQALDPNYVKNVLANNDAIRKNPELLINADPLIRDVYTSGGVRGSLQTEKNTLVLTVAMMKRAALTLGGRKLNDYCALRPQEELCSALQVISLSLPTPEP